MKILNFDSDTLIRSDISHLEDENIAVFLTLLAIGGSLSFLHSSFILLLCLFFLLHDSLHSVSSELRHKSINA